MPMPVPPAASAIPVTEAQNPVRSNPFVSFGDMTAPTFPPSWIEQPNATQTTSILTVGPGMKSLLLDKLVLAGNLLVQYSLEVQEPKANGKWRYKSESPKWSTTSGYIQYWY